MTILLVALKLQGTFLTNLFFSYMQHEKTSQTLRDLLTATLKATSVKSCKTKTRQNHKMFINSCWKDEFNSPEPSDSGFRGTTLRKFNSQSTCSHGQEIQPKVAATNIDTRPFFPNLIALLEPNNLTDVYCDLENRSCKSQQRRSSIVSEIPDYVLNCMKFPDTFFQDIKDIDTHRSNGVKRFELNQETCQDKSCKIQQWRSSLVYEIPDCVPNGIKSTDPFFQEMKYTKTHGSNEMISFEKDQETISIHDNGFASNTFFQRMEHSRSHISNDSNGLKENQAPNQIHTNEFFYDIFFQDKKEIQTHMTGHLQGFENNKETSPIHGNEAFSDAFLQELTYNPTHRSSHTQALENLGKNKTTSPISDNQYLSDTIFQYMNYTHTNGPNSSEGLDTNKETSPIDDNAIFSDDDLLKVLGRMEFE